MKKVVEPPVLMSKILTFVLSGSVVVLLVLAFTLIKMIPLERPEVFFLWTPTRATNVTIDPMNPDTTNEATFNRYLEGFVREYIIARYTLYPGTKVSITRDNWKKIVKPWSSSKVFSDFSNTRLYKRYELNPTVPSVSCYVDFANTAKERAVFKMRNGLYEVRFVWVCKNENSGGQPIQKNYKIQLRLKSELETKISGVLDDLQKLHENPLGIRVVEYNIIQGDSKDPLNSDVGV